MSTVRFGLLTWAALVVLQLAWYLWLAPPQNGQSGLALALALPALLLPLLAYRRGARRMLLWVGIVSLFYFAHGIVAAYSEPTARVPAILEALLCVLLIGVLGVIARRDKAMRRPGGKPHGG